MDTGPGIMEGFCSFCQAWYTCSNLFYCIQHPYLAIFVTHAPLRCMHICELAAYNDVSFNMCCIKMILLFAAMQGSYSSMFSNPCAQIITLYVTGVVNTVLSPEHQKEILRYIYNHQARLILYFCNFFYKHLQFCAGRKQIKSISFHEYGCRMKMEGGGCTLRATAQCLVHP
jgi:hypothetical protein